MAKAKARKNLTLPEKAFIKQEQAAFIDKIQNAPLNEHQQAIIEAARSGKGRYVVLAGPGSGKTFTAVKASTTFTGSAIYFSYNKKIQVDTTMKLIAIDSTMTATTAHSYGLSCLMAYNRGQCKIDDKDEKYPTIIKFYISNRYQIFLKTIAEELKRNKEIDPEVMRLEAISWSKQLVHYAQVSLTPLTYEGLTDLVDEFDLTDIKTYSLVWPFVVDCVIDAIEEGKDQFLGLQHLLNYDDMIYYPNILPNIPTRQYDHIVVDEAQDTSKASLELMLKAAHPDSQIFFIGDRKQSIYAFAGANFNSIDQIIERLQADTLPLRICYRCGSKIVDLANQLGGELISANLHEGTVNVIEEYIDHLQPGDAVLSRTTANLIQACLRTLQKGKRAKVLGKNLGDNIAAIITRLETKRIKRGTPDLADNLSNLLELLEEYEHEERDSLAERRKNPDLAIAELSDKVETVKAFFEAYISKCNDTRLQAPEDPKCNFNKSSHDFKLYIRGLFSEDDHATDLILFMTAHRAKGGEWKNVYIIGTSEFPHPKATSARQKQQEQNLMYVAITRAIKNLSFVNAPFECLSVPGYEPAEPLTIISIPSANFLEVYPSTIISEDDREERTSLFTGVHDFGAGKHNLDKLETSIYDESGFEDYHPDVVDTLFRDSLIDDSIESLQTPFIEQEKTIEAEELTHTESTTIIEEMVQGSILEPLEGRVSKAIAIEILCPTCNDICEDPITGSQFITETAKGHSVTCSGCKKSCIVPLNAFTQKGEVIAREKPATSVPNSKIEKKGRTKKERKSNAGRKAKSGVVRQPMQLSLDVRTITALNAMGINKSELFEELLKQYEPFLNAYAESNDEDPEEDFED